MTSPISTRRLRFAAGLLVFVMLAVIVQAVRIQVVEAGRFARRAEQQQRVARYDIAPRGRIFDRFGTPLAVSRRAFRVRLDLARRAQVEPRLLAERLAAVTGVSPDALERRIAALREAPAPESTLLAFALTPQEAYNFTRTLDVHQQSWVVVEPHWWRVYPQGDIAGPLLGIVGLDQEGFFGVEGFYESTLRSRPGLRWEHARMDVEVISHTVEGADLVLTIDLDIQTYVEKRLRQALQDTGARRGVILVMETPTGAILAAAAVPGFDPNHAAFRLESNTWEDPWVSVAYEPGSVLKATTLAAALDSGVITPSTVYSDTGRLVVKDFYVYNANRARYGAVTPEDILAFSSNVGAAQVALDLGAERFVKYAPFWLRQPHRRGSRPRSAWVCAHTEQSRVAPCRFGGEQLWARRARDAHPVGERLQRAGERWAAHAALRGGIVAHGGGRGHREEACPDGLRRAARDGATHAALACAHVRTLAARGVAAALHRCRKDGHCGVVQGRQTTRDNDRHPGRLRACRSTARDHSG